MATAAELLSPFIASKAQQWQKSGVMNALDDLLDTSLFQLDDNSLQPTTPVHATSTDLLANEQIWNATSILKVGLCWASYAFCVTPKTSSQHADIFVYNKMATAEHAQKISGQSSMTLGDMQRTAALSLFAKVIDKAANTQKYLWLESSIDYCFALKKVIPEFSSNPKVVAAYFQDHTVAQNGWSDATLFEAKVPVHWFVNGCTNMANLNSKSFDIPNERLQPSMDTMVKLISEKYPNYYRCPPEEWKNEEWKNAIFDKDPEKKEALKLLVADWSSIQNIEAFCDPLRPGATLTCMLQAAPTGDCRVPFCESLWFSSHGGWSIGPVVPVLKKLQSEYFEVLIKWKSFEFLIMEKVLRMVQLKAFTVNLRTGEMADPCIEQKFLEAACRLAVSRETDPSLGFPGNEVTQYTDDEKTKRLMSSDRAAM